MSLHRHNPCTTVRNEFSAYLDGAVSGVEMSAIASHLDGCSECAAEFALWREVQVSLAELGPAKPPAQLQKRLRAVIAEERARGSHLPFFRRARLLWQSSLAPMALRVSGGLAAALVIVGGLSWMFAAPISVQANDDRMAHFIAPRYLYSQVPPQAIVTQHDTPIIVDAKVDDRGRVYDYSILEGPHDAQVKVRVEDNLLSSVFKPATVFGEPVRGHVVVLYTGVSVHG
jgi:hypothetical protein